MTILLDRLRRDGFAVRADAGKLLVSPAARLTPELRAEIAEERDGLLTLVEAEQMGPVPSSTTWTGHARHWEAAPAVDAQAWAEAVAWFAWFASAELPAEPYRVNSATVVTDPAQAHAWLRRRIAEGCLGGVQREVYARLTRLREIIEGER